MAFDTNTPAPLHPDCQRVLARAKFNREREAEILRLAKAGNPNKLVSARDAYPHVFAWAAKKEER